MLFLRSGPRSAVKDLWLLDLPSGMERPLVQADALLRGKQEELSPEERARRERMRQSSRGITSFQLSRDGRKILFSLSGRLFLVDRGTGAAVELPEEGGPPIQPRFSPDGRKVAVVRDGDLWVIDLDGRIQRRLTKRSSPSITNGLAEFIAQEEMQRFSGFWWSPDSRSIAFQETDTEKVEPLHLFDPYRPLAPPSQWPYPRPGKKNASVRLGIIPAAGGKPTWVRWDRASYPYLASVVWEAGAPLTVLVQNRLQSEELLLSVNLGSGATQTLLTERDATWINLDQSVPRWLPEGRGFLWATERRGAWQLELRERDGRLRRILTDPKLGYRSLIGVDAAGLEAIVLASSNPTETHLYRIPLSPPAADGTPEAIALTTDPGVHAGVFSRDHSLFVHVLSSLTGEKRYTVRRADGSPIGEVRSVAQALPFLPSLELVQLPNEHELRAAVIRPRNFDPTLRYPVITYVYGGPLVQLVTAARDRYLLQQWMADHGFIVVSIDGRGTPSRGRAWERAIHRNLAEIPLEDQVAGLQLLGERYPSMDLGRVGIYGWSFGGYLSSLAVMRRPDVFHAGAAGAPVADWLDYDTHYTERYLDLPSSNPKGYRASSSLTYAEGLERPLLIIHGTADDNVFFTHALQLSDALFQAGRPYEFLPLAGSTHMVSDPLVTTRLYERIISFFKAQLGGPLAPDPISQAN